MEPIIPAFSEQQLADLKITLANSSPQQLAWLSGYLWAKSTQTNAEKNNEAATAPVLHKNELSLPCVTVISISQTGNARHVAKEICSEMTGLGFNVTYHSAADYKFKQIDQSDVLLIVTSTQGEGEIPEEGVPLYKFLTSKKAPSLSNTHYAVLGLGDSSYTYFCKAGKDIDERLELLGAKRFMERGAADLDFEEYCKQWQYRMIDQLSSLTQPSNQALASTDTTIISSEQQYHYENPFLATVSVNQKITGRDSDRDIRHIELDITDSGLRYQPGDSLGVWYRNDAALVTELLGYLKQEPQTLVEVKGKQVSLSAALTKHYELTQNTPKITKAYAQFSQNQLLIDLIQDKQATQTFSEQTPLVDMIRCYPPQSVNITDFLEILRPLLPRMYSIASAQDEVGEEVHLTVGLVQYQIDSLLRKGGASGYLASLEEGDEVAIFVESNETFRLPSDSSLPIIMIGAGTGVAPFRAFIQQREAESAQGKNWLIFGNPHFVSDFLYQLEWQRYVKNKVLNKIDLAWSRDQAEKIYVQDQLYKQADEVWKWLQEGAHIYICGDATRMAKAVDDTLLTIIEQKGNMTAEQSDEYLTNLRSQKRYQRDVY